MRRRPLLVVLVLVVAALCCSRLVGGGGGDEDGGDEGRPSEWEPGAEQAPPAPAASPRSPLPPAEPAASQEPEAGHQHEDGDRVTGGEGIDPAAVPDALRTAEEFAQQWSTPDTQPARLAGVATAALAASLTEPLPHPPSGPAYLLFDAPEWARVGVPTDQGTIVLDVVRVEGDWLVSALAWWPRGEEP